LGAWRITRTVGYEKKKRELRDLIFEVRRNRRIKIRLVTSSTGFGPALRRSVGPWSITSMGTRLRNKFVAAADQSDVNRLLVGIVVLTVSPA
jgi:hypothetical protein